MRVRFHRNFQTRDKRFIKNSKVFTILGFIYLISCAFLFLGWINVLSLDWQIWERGSLPFYILVFCVASISCFFITKLKKRAILSLLLGILATWLLNLVYPTKMELGSTMIGLAIFAVVLVEIRRLWPQMN